MKTASKNFNLNVNDRKEEGKHNGSKCCPTCKGESKLTTETGEAIPAELGPFINVLRKDGDKLVVSTKELEAAKVRKNGGEFLVGHITVDSGQVIISDPCYLKGWKAGELYGEPADNDYTKSCELSHGSGGELKIAGVTVELGGRTLQSSGGVAVVSGTVCGDGTFPVFAHWKNGRLLRLTIELDAA